MPSSLLDQLASHPEMWEPAMRAAARQALAFDGCHCHAGWPVTLTRDLHHDTWLATCDHCGHRVTVTCHAMEQLALPIAREKARETTLGRLAHSADVRADVRANPTGLPVPEMVERAERAVEDRDPDAAERSIAEILDHYRPVVPE